MMNWSWLQRVFAIQLVVLLLVFSAGWYAFTLGADNPVPWTVFNVWANMITVGMAVEQLVGYTPTDGKSLAHAALVVTSAAICWAIVFTIAVVALARCVRMVRTLLPSRLPVR